jgi:hypothetical protein
MLNTTATTCTLDGTRITTSPRQSTSAEYDVYVTTAPPAEPNLTITVSTIEGQNGATFTSEGDDNLIHCVATISPQEYQATYGPKIRWKMWYDPALNDSGTTKSVDVSSTTGDNVRMKFSVANKDEAPNGRLHALSLSVKAYIPSATNPAQNMAETTSGSLSQDGKDVLRQRYWDVMITPRDGDPTHVSESGIKPLARERYIDQAAYDAANKTSLPFTGYAACKGGSKNPTCTSTDPTRGSKNYPMCMHCTHGIWAPDNIISMASNFQKIQDAYTSGTINVTCGFRCPVHNKCVSHAPDSRHMNGNAFDFAQSTAAANYQAAQIANDTMQMPQVFLYKSDEKEIAFKNASASGAWTHGHVSTP